MKTTSARPSRNVSPAGTKKGAARRREASESVIDLVPSLVKLDSILVPIDFSKTSLRALQYAVRLAEQFGGKLIVVNVIEPVAAPDFAAVALLVENDKSKKAAENRLHALLKDLKVPARVVEKVLVRTGAPFAEITSAAKTLKVDLIVLTTHGFTGLKHVLMGSTAERVVRHAPCPVLTVRDKAR